MNSLQKLLDFLNRLDDAALTYTLDHQREDTLMVLINPPGQRWEVEFFVDGNVEVEVFYSNSAEEGFEGEEALDRLFTDFDDDEEDDYDENEDEDEDYDDYDDEEDEESEDK